MLGAALEHNVRRRFLMTEMNILIPTACPDASACRWFPVRLCSNGKITTLNIDQFAEKLKVFSGDYHYFVG
jgi:hypothetical protein